MAIIKCAYCDAEFERNFFESWHCDAGCGYWCLSIKRYDVNEIKNVFNFFKFLKSGYSNTNQDFFLILAKDIQSLENKEDFYFQSYIDTLLLFVEGLVIPNIPKKLLAKTIGEEKFEIYEKNNLIKCINTSNFMWMKDFDEILIKREDDEVSNKFYYALMNIYYVFLKDAIENDCKFNFFEKHRINKYAHISYNNYEYNIDFVLVKMLEEYIRVEFACFLYGFNFMHDRYFNIIKKYR